MDALFVIVPVVIVSGFVLVFGFIAASTVQGTLQWRRNNASPRRTVAAVVVTKRSNTSGGVGDTIATTTHYATFEYDGGSRLELMVTGRDYGMLVEWDSGFLTFQGTRYKGFQRSAAPR